MLTPVQPNDLDAMFSRLSSLPLGARQRYYRLLATDLSNAVQDLRADLGPQEQLRTLHSLVGVLGTAGAPCYALALEANQMAKKNELTRDRLEELVANLIHLLDQLDRSLAEQ